MRECVTNRNWKTATVFEYGSMCNDQVQFARSRHALPITRDDIGMP